MRKKSRRRGNGDHHEDLALYRSFWDARGLHPLKAGARGMHQTSDYPTDALNIILRTRPFGSRLMMATRRQRGPVLPIVPGE